MEKNLRIRGGAIRLKQNCVVRFLPWLSLIFKLILARSLRCCGYPWRPRFSPVALSSNTSSRLQKTKFDKEIKSKILVNVKVSGVKGDLVGPNNTVQFCFVMGSFFNGRFRRALNS